MYGGPALFARERRKSDGRRKAVKEQMESNEGGETDKVTKMNEELIKIKTKKVQWWHLNVGDNQQLFNWT